MTRKQVLRREPNMERANGYGQYYFTCLYNGEKKRIHTTNSEFWDKFQNAEYMSREWFSMCRNILKMFQKNRV